MTTFSPPSTPQNAPDRTLVLPTSGAKQSTLKSPSKPVADPTHGPSLALVSQADFTNNPLNRGLNPLVNSASTLLTVAIQLRSVMSHQPVPELHRRLTLAIQRFENDAKQAKSSDHTVVSARYLLCSFVDEVVLNSPWGAASGWSQRSLLSLFHQETFGGEKCFLILQHLLKTPNQHTDLLELFYLCLSLGFQGKYRLARNGSEQLENIRDKLYRAITDLRPPMERGLSPHWKGLLKPQKHMKRLVPMWVITCCALALMLMSFSAFRWWLSKTSEPTIQYIEQLHGQATLH